MSKRRQLGSLLMLAGVASVACATATTHSTAAGRLESAPPLPALTGRAMGTTWAVKWLQPDPPLDPTTVEREVAARLEQLEQQFSTYRPNSVLSRFNATRTIDWFAVPAELAQVAQRAREISALTAGAFDVTVLPLLQLWGFGPYRARDTWPTDSEITAARAGVDWRRLEVRLSPPALRKADPQLSADFSSLAKGFAVDVISDWFAASRAANHLVQIGGDVRAAGPGPDHHGWRVAIEQPAAGARTAARLVSLTDQALSTSGAQRNFLVLGGRRAGHILDPRTGLPAAGPLASVSVIHASCAASSALATGLFVLGFDEGFALAEREHLAGLFIVRENGALLQRATSKFESRFNSAINERLP